MGFTLGIANAPAGAVLWNANFAEKSFDYTPTADSGWLAIDEIWNYPSDPRGVTSLHIWILDAGNNILLNVWNLGPVNDGKDYVYDGSTRVLSEVTLEEGPFSSISITAPSSAEEGQRVSVSTRVTNISANSRLFRVRLYAVRDIFEVPDPEERIGSLEVVIRSGQSQVVNGSFTMPAWDTNFLVMVHRFIDFWDFDNYASKVVSLEVVEPPVEPEYKGTMIKKELEYNESRRAIPVY